MMGPSFSIRIRNTWKIGLTGLIGLSKNQFKHSTLAMEASYLYPVIPSSFIDAYIDIGSLEARRYDADLTVERSIHKYCNLLFGARFNYNDGEGSSIRFLYLNPFPVNKTTEEFFTWYVGPSVGAGFYYEVKGFSINIGVSALFQFGIFYLERYLLNPGLYIFNFISDEFYLAHVSIGADCNLKLAYFINRIRLEVWVGGRYIILPHIAVADIGSAYNAVYKNGWITGEFEQFYGVMFGAAYKF